MSTIKVKVPITPEFSEIEVQTPCFRKSKYGTIFKINSDKEAVYVTSDSIAIHGFVMSLAVDAESAEATEDEFFQAYIVALKKIKDATEKQFTEQIEKA